MGQDLLGAIKRSLVMLQSDSSGLYNEDAWGKLQQLLQIYLRTYNIKHVDYSQMTQA